LSAAEAPAPAILAHAPEPVTRQHLADQLADQGGLTPERALQITDLLADLGIIVEGVPPCRKVLADAQTFAERTILAELVVRLFRFFVLGSIVLPDTPAAMDWLKTYIDGVGHGPLGAGPLRWPGMIPSAINVLTQWGFEPTPSTPAYVIKRRGG
jgi:hypothetical protein